MDEIQKSTIKKLGVAGIISTVVIVAFSLPLGGLPALGDLLFPGDGIWDLPGEVPENEVFTIEGLTGNVSVYRDEWGIPHIYGTSEPDLAFALGYIHAQDRLFQMEMAKRLTRGRLAEIIGSEAIPVDKFNLNMLKEYWANETLNAMRASTDPEIQKMETILDTYVKGVNFFIDRNRNNLPLEFKLLDFEPGTWTALDSLCFEKYMTEMLTWSYEDIYSLLLTEKLGATNYSQLYGSPQPYQSPICPNYGEYSDISSPGKEVPAPAGSEDDAVNPLVSDLFESFLTNLKEIPQERQRIENQEIIGSNNWVVSGNKTPSGKPILCNDMHLAWDLPGIWYEAHLVDIAHDWNFYGFFLAGVPVGIVGHTENVAWGFTNTGYDVIDFYYYNAVDADHYLYKGTSTAYSKKSYTIPVKGGAPVEYIVKSTVHGPIFTDYFDTDTESEGLPTVLKNQEIAIKWVAQNVTWDFVALYGYAHATNRAEFDAASDWFTAPAQNHAYADKWGTIAIRPTGEVPLRDDKGIPAWHLGNGSMPYNGSAGQGEWKSYIPFSELPNAVNVSQDYLASANQIVAGPDYFTTYTLQHSYDSGYRARRINTLLASDDAITLEDMKKFQLDVYSTMAGNFTPIFVSFLEKVQSLDATENAALLALKDWDYVMDMAESAPSIYYIWQEIFSDKTFVDDLTVVNLTGGFRPSHAVLEKLMKTDSGSHWFDDLGTGPVEDRDDIMLLAFQTAIDALADYFGTTDITQWKWGEIHQRYFVHLTGIASLSAGPYPSNGSGTTVNPSFSRVWNTNEGKIDPRPATGGGSERLIVDFGDLNKSVSVIPSGERGITTSKHYTDQLEMFQAGEYHTQYFMASTPEDIQAWANIESTIIFKVGGS